jgi:hypothetical protein
MEKEIFYNEKTLLSARNIDLKNSNFRSHFDLQYDEAHFYFI